jgi:hypothetical protein
MPLMIVSSVLIDGYHCSGLSITVALQQFNFPIGEKKRSEFPYENSLLFARRQPLGDLSNWLKWNKAGAVRPALFQYLN